MPRSDQLSREELIARQAFQLSLMDQLRGIAGPSDILAYAIEALGRHLQVERCGLAVVSENASLIRIDVAWSAEGLVGPPAHAKSLDPCGEDLLGWLTSGATFVRSSDDAELSDCSEFWPEARALIVCPILRENRLEAMLYVQMSETRRWTAGEIATVEDVAWRLREAVDRARSEAALGVIERRYNSLFSSIDAGLCIIKVRFGADGSAEDYRFLEVNEAFETYTGIPGAVGRWMREIAPAHEQHWFDLFGRVAQSGISERMELPAQALDDRWYLVHAFRIDAPEDNHVAILFSDLTDRRRTERALERRTEELELAVRAGDLGRFDFKPKEGTLTWDARCRALFGLSADTLVSYESAFLAGLHPDDRERADKAVAAALDPDGSHHFAVDYRTVGIEDGVLRHLSAHGLAFFDGKVPVRLIGTVQDVTSDREASGRLRETEERLRLAGRATNDAVWDWDFRTNHVIWNEALERAYGHLLSTVEPTGEWWLAHIHPDDRTDVDHSIHAVIDGDGTDWIGEYRFEKADGSYADILDRGYVIRNVDGKPLRMVGAMLDVSARKAIERQLAEERQRLTDEVATTAAERDRIEEALRQSQKMEAVGQLTGGLAHDFNNLLTGISGSLEMMQIRIAQGRASDIEKYALAAQGAVRRAAALTHRLLAFSRRQTLDPKPTDVNRLVSDLEDLVRRTVGPQIEVETVGKAGVWGTLVDPNQLENALLNLCINARDAMPDGGRITIETANRWIDDRGGHERDLKPGQYVSICVTDTGTGMTDDVVARAFDPFFTTKPLGEGTGLGLSMIYGFARQSGGQVRIYTEIGLGTTMCIYLPRHMETGAFADPEAAVGVSVMTSVAKENGCVMVVDDEPTVRMLVVEVVEELGYEVVEAVDGPSAMRILEKQPTLELLVTDVGLPGGMNGRQLADAAIQLMPDLKVIFITGYAENAIIGNGQLDQNMSVITKPFAMEALARKVKQIIGQD